MKIPKYSFPTKHTIRKPMWNGRKVGIATYKIGEHNIITITAKDTDGRYLFSIDGGETPAEYYASREQLLNGEDFKLGSGVHLKLLSIGHLDLYEGTAT